MIWLGIETANAPLSVAIVEDNKIIVEITQHVKLTHSVGAMPTIEEALQRAGLQAQQIDAIAVSAGPGSYTGVRIGVTLAKTLAWTLHKPLVLVPSLQALAANGRLHNGVICALIDARRDNVYAGIYEGGTLQPLIAEGHYALADIMARLVETEQPVLVIGDATAKYSEQLAQLGEQAQVAHFTMQLPRASEIIALAQQLPMLEGDAIHHAVPSYHRIAEAEANWLKEQKANDK